MSYATFDAIKIGIASPEMIREWSYAYEAEYINRVSKTTYEAMTYALDRVKARTLGE